MVKIIKLFKNDKYSEGEIGYLLEESLVHSRDINLIAENIYESFVTNDIKGNDVLKIYCSLCTNCLVLVTLQNICSANNVFLIVNTENKAVNGKVAYVMNIKQNLSMHRELIDKVNKHIKLIGGT